MDSHADVITKELDVPRRDPGSFRDPSGSVVHLGGSVFRAVDAACADRFDALQCAGLMEALQASGLLIPTRRVRAGEPEHATLRKHAPEAGAFLHHERVPFVSYPFEWSTSMLADAALCCLDLQLTLMEHGYSLKDASAYNIQFVRGRAVFIDVPSIEPVVRRDIWMALDQFSRMFLFPLLLERYGKGETRAYFLAHLDGMTLDDVATIFGRGAWLRPSLWLDVALPHRLQTRAARRFRQLRAGVSRRSDDPRALAWNLRRLRRKIERLRRASTVTSRWSGYATDNSYTREETDRKEAFVTRFLDDHPLERLLDLGCNTGRFARLAAKRGIGVVAVDADRACVDRVYLASRDQGLDLTPLIVNLASPSPGIGFRNVERASFLQRAEFDGVFCLALIHHLLVTSRIPLPAIVDLLADLTDRNLLVELVDPRDPMFASLVGAGESLYGHLTLDHYLREFARRFTLSAQTTVTPYRTLAAFRKTA